MTGDTHAHADLDALADALAAESDGTAVPPDLRSCPTCGQALDDLRSALGAVADDFTRLPAVPDLPSRLTAPLPAAAPVSGPTTVLPDGDVVPLDTRRAPRWLLPAGGIAAAAVLVVGGGLLLTHGRTDSTTASRSAGSPAKLAISSTGAHYTKSSLDAAVPGLLKATKTAFDSSTKATSPRTATGVGGTESATDPLARLRDASALAACLAGLTGPGDTSLPLALDYASFDGKPALVVVLPSSRTSKLDVFVVGASCSQADQDVLYYLHADRPQG